MCKVTIIIVMYNVWVFQAHTAFILYSTLLVLWGILSDSKIRKHSTEHRYRLFQASQKLHSP